MQQQITLEQKLRALREVQRIYDLEEVAATGWAQRPDAQL